MKLILLSTISIFLCACSSVPSVYYAVSSEDVVGCNKLKRFSVFENDEESAIPKAKKIAFKNGADTIFIPEEAYIAPHSDYSLEIYFHAYACLIK